MYANQGCKVLISFKKNAVELHQSRTTFKFGKKCALESVILLGSEINHMSFYREIVAA